jgi:hypothetical protein
MSKNNNSATAPVSALSITVGSAAAARERERESNGSSNPADSVTDSAAAAAVVFVERLRDARAHDLPPRSLDVLGIVVAAEDLLAGSQSSGGGSGSTPNGCSDRFSPMDLSAFVPALKPGASVHVCVLGETGNGGAWGDGASPTSASSQSLQRVQAAFVLAGLTGSSESKRADGTRVLSATWNAPPSAAEGSVGRIGQLRQPRHAEGSAPAGPGGSGSGGPLKILDDDLLDEDVLLSSGVLAPPPAMSAAAGAAGDDCGGRKACDNCTCGRADEERRAAAAASENDRDGTNQPRPVVPTSSCGKCGLGDAFRCASCPYLGKPAFKPGEEHLVLDLQDDL